MSIDQKQDYLCPRRSCFQLTDTSLVLFKSVFMAAQLFGTGYIFCAMVLKFFQNRVQFSNDGIPSGHEPRGFEKSNPGDRESSQEVLFGRTRQGSISRRGKDEMPLPGAFHFLGIPLKCAGRQSFSEVVGVA